MSSWHRRADASVDDPDLGLLERPRPRFAVRFRFRKDPISRFGQVAGDRPDGRLMAARAGDALVELAYVPVRRARPASANDVGGFP